MTTWDTAQFVVGELAEAASRTGDRPSLEAALEWVSDRARVTRSDWVLGIEARVRALLAAGDAAEQGYRESIALLGRTRLRMELARGHLLYGEWLRREARRVDAREQLRSAHELFGAIGARRVCRARAPRAARDRGDGPQAHRRHPRRPHAPGGAHRATRRAGRTNPEIGAELFISPRTVEWHLKKVFTKLGITSRKGLRDALPARDGAVVAA